MKWLSTSPTAHSRSFRLEHSEQLKAEALGVETLQLHVSAVSVVCERAPALRDGLVAVDLADILTTITGIGDQINPSD